MGCLSKPLAAGGSFDAWIERKLSFWALECRLAWCHCPNNHFSMSIEEIKKVLIALSEAEQSEVTAFLFHLRHSRDPDYQDVVTERLSDADASHWVTPEEFEKRLNQR